MRALTIGVFAALALAGVGLAVAARVRPRAIAPLTVVLEHMLSHRAARIAVVLFWWWLAWHFLVARTVDA